MSRPRRRSNNNRRRRAPRVVDMWRPVPALPPPAPIAPADDPTALLRSLGDVPLHGQGAVAEHYVGAVIEKAARTAEALAAAAGLLADPRADD